MKNGTLNAVATVFCGLIALFELHINNSTFFIINAAMSAVNAGYAYHYWGSE